MPCIISSKQLLYDTIYLFTDLLIFFLIRMKVQAGRESFLSQMLTYAQDLEKQCFKMMNK